MQIGTGVIPTNTESIVKETAAEANKDADKEKPEPSLIDDIREKGFSAYVKEIQIKKMEELREKILEAMGLSEEQLEEMPAEQRNQIEDMIAEEIRRRMMSQAAMNGDRPPAELGKVTDPLGMGNVQNSMNTGLALLQAVEQSGPANSADKDDDDG